MNIKFNKNEVDFLIDEFSILTDSLYQLKIDGLKKGSRVYSVNLPLNADVYIIDSLSGKDIACHPSIVGEELEKLCLDVAEDAARTMIKLGFVTHDYMYIDVLRAAPGYKLEEALHRLGKEIKQKSIIRPRYTQPSYRDHEGGSKKIEIIFENFDNFPENKKLHIIKPDTEATGRTSEAVLKRIIEVAENKNCEIDSVLLYGFISESGLEHIVKFLTPYNIKVAAFAIGNITALYSNGYDMPIYGPDEHYYSLHKVIKKLGGIIPRETLERYVNEFIPGSDQPGDWSARFKKVFNGIDFESGGISNHLRNSISF
ncbi:MAG: hypothetical protein QXQ18_02275 [Candidatus Aenigmatarchaeota archaeon]